MLVQASFSSGSKLLYLEENKTQLGESHSSRRLVKSELVKYKNLKIGRKHVKISQSRLSRNGKRRPNPNWRHMKNTFSAKQKQKEAMNSTKKRPKRKLRSKTMKISRLQRNQSGTQQKVSLNSMNRTHKSRFQMKLFLISTVTGQWKRKKRMLWQMLIGQPKNSDKVFAKEGAILKQTNQQVKLSLARGVLGFWGFVSV